MTAKVKLLFKTLLSLWAVFNIFTMFVMPNIGSYIGRATSKIITPYANSVGMNASWNFFSPDPAHTMYIRYLVHFLDADGIETQDPIEGFFPSEKNQPVHDITRKRDLYAMRFFVIEPKRMRTILGPWLCQQNPGATAIDMEHVIETVPSLDQAVLLRSEEVRDLSKEVQYVREVHSCQGGVDEEEL